MYGIAIRLLPRGSWGMLPKIYDDKEKALGSAWALKEGFKDIRVVYLGDVDQWTRP